MLAGAVRDLAIERLQKAICDIENGNHQSFPDTKQRLESFICILMNFNQNGEIDSIITLIIMAIDELDHYRYAHTESLTLSTENTGMKGRPVIIVPADLVEFFIDCGFSQKDMSSLLGISRRTLCRRLEDMGISMATKFTNISNAELDDKIQQIIVRFPNIGYRSVKSHLASVDVIVQEERIRKAMRRVDLEGVVTRLLLLKPVARRIYNVRAPLALWHIDGYHKLIR